MNLILDTHAILWFAANPSKLSANAREAITSPANQRLISIASFWEIVIKVSLGKISMSVPFVDFQAQLLAGGFTLLPVAVEHLLELEKLEYHHRDPFDRILLAQSISLGYPIVSRDSSFNSYDVELIW